MADKDTGEVYYVNIRNSHSLRRGILETSKGVIEILHRYEKFKKLRADRVRAIEELIINFREINEICAQMKVDMPKIKLPQIKKPKKAEAVMPKVTKKPFAHESDDELKKLENAIAQIEQRLGQIK